MAFAATRARTEAKRSKPCCVSGSSANTTGDLETDCSEATERAGLGWKRGVSRSVHDQERWGVRPGETGRRAGGIGAARAEVAVHRHRSRDAGVGLLESGLEPRVIRCERRRDRQVPAGGRPDQEDLIGIGAVLAGVRSHPRDHPLRVHQRLGKRSFGTEPVVRADAEPAVIGELIQQRDALAALATLHEAPAVQLDHDRTPGRGIRPSIDVETVSASARRVRDIAHALHRDLVPLERQQDAAHPRCARRRGRRRRTRVGSRRASRRPGRRSAPPRTPVERSGREPAATPSRG